MFNGLPEPRRVLLGKTHDALCGTVAQEICFFDAVDESVSHDHSLRVEAHEILSRPVTEVDGQTPRKR